MSHPCEQQTGFTLLELIVALAISSLVAVIGAAAMSSALDFYHRNAYRSAAREDVRAVERAIRYEWATRSKAVRSDGSMLEFETLFPVTGRASSASTLAHVRYACETSPNEGIVLTHRVSSLPTGVPRIGQRTQPSALEETRVLATRLQICAFSFLGEKPTAQGKPQPVWLSTWDEKTAAPALMRLSLSGLRDDMPPVVYQARTAAGAR